MVLIPLFCNFSLRIRLVLGHDPDVVVGETMMRSGKVGLGHVTTGTLLGPDLTKLRPWLAGRRSVA